MEFLRLWHIREEILLKAFPEENFRECFDRRSALADLWLQRANPYLVVHPLTEENLALFLAFAEGEASLFYLDYGKQRILEILPPGQDAWQQELWAELWASVSAQGTSQSTHRQHHGAGSKTTERS